MAVALFEEKYIDEEGHKRIYRGCLLNTWGLTQGLISAYFQACMDDSRARDERPSFEDRYVLGATKGQLTSVKYINCNASRKQN